MIEVSHLTKKYGSRLAVDDISFTVEDGVIYGLLGPNGAGKSTIMNILTGYLAATEGQVTVAGHPLPEEADAAKACVGYLPEQPPLYPEMTVAEYLDFAAELKGVKKADRPAQVQSAARRTGLEDVLPRLIRSLSKGYRQRVGVAQALLGSPQLIILDEPVSALDVSVQSQVLNLLLELQEERKLSYLFIAHDLAVVKHISPNFAVRVKHISDRVAVMYLGKIVEMSDAETIYRSPKHAYTKALLDAIPEPDPARANKHQPLPGDVPSPINPPLGSAFGHRIQHPSYPETVGADLTPVEIEPGHWVAPDPCSLEPEDWNKVRQR